MTTELTLLAGNPDNDPLNRPIRDLTLPEFYEAIAARFAIPPGSGEVTIEIVYRKGRFARAHRHETITAHDQGDAA